MNRRLWTFWLALAFADALAASAMANTLAPTSVRMAPIRIEPTRPGGIGGLPRGIESQHDLDAQSNPSTKSTPKAKRRRR